jgi:WD40 repeat protein
MKYAISISKMFLGILLITLSISLPAASAQTASSREFYPSSIDWNSAQDLIAVGDEGGQVEIIDLSTNTQILNTQIGDQRINKLLWHPSGNQLAGAAGGQVVVWDKIGNTLQTLKPAYAQERYYALVWNVQLDQLLTHSEAAERGYVDYWDIPSGQSVKRERSGTLLDMQMSPDGTVFAVANVINIILRDPLSFEPKSKITQTVRGGLGYDIVIFTWSPDSTQIATGSINGTVRLWDVASGQMLLDLRASDNPVKEGPPSYVYDLRFSPDGKQLMSVFHQG